MTPQEKRRQEIHGRYARFIKAGIWKYNSTHDAYYNAKTRIWVESKCRDRKCRFCVGRPRLAPTSTRSKA